MWFKSKKFKELEKKYNILWNIHMKLLEEHEDLSDRASELHNEVNVLFEENIDKECKIMTGFSDAFRASGMSKEELDRYYYFYYWLF